MTIASAVILSAGKGSRLYPHTEDKPKCLLPLAGRTLLEWQLDALKAAGIVTVTVVTGFHHELVDAVVAARGEPGVRTLFNPFYQVADNLGSVWIARGCWERDLLLLNGDTLVSPDLVRAVLAGVGDAPIAVTIDRKPTYDADDMKVLSEGGQLKRIGKALTECDAESIGCLAFQGDGRRIFVQTVERVMATPEGVRVWYLSVIDAIAAAHPVATVSIEGQEWQEVDYPADLDAAAALTERWAAAGY